MDNIGFLFEDSVADSARGSVRDRHFPRAPDQKYTFFSRSQNPTLIMQSTTLSS